ncbi:FadR/GntR family transcriptional regulator [Novosphingobium rosa]|uniref:FadR/GntR family transcriptional regulator n=1 Tax=Novosphingobium rosa TaxID=76978 RepID=UPI0008318B26|nr:FadR/GntR family transcriptional regulator [Novosphingobium rosa]
MLDALGRSIVTGEFSHKSFPTENDLAHSYGVSRSVTREATKMLSAKGLLTARPRQGTSIQPETSWNLFDPDVLRWLLERAFSLELLAHFTQLRVAIEPMAAELAARNASGEGLALIEAAYRRMEAAERGEEDGLLADIAFHVSILEASNNPFYAQFRDVVGTALKKSIVFTNRFAGRQASLPAHKAVMDAIKAGDTANAHAAMAMIVHEVMQLIDQARRDEG